jgi:hypothetical protein
LGIGHEHQSIEGGRRYGALADLGPASSTEAIDEARREMWANAGKADDE